MFKYMLAVVLIMICGCVTNEFPRDEGDMGNALDMYAAGNTGGWSASGNLIMTDHLKDVTLQAVFPVSTDYTIEFSKRDGQGSTTLAEIVWSVEGNSVRRVVDVFNGQSVTGVGQGVRIRIFDNTVDKPASTYTVSVQVAPGTRGTFVNPPYREAGFATIAGGAIFVLTDIPLDTGIHSIAILISSAGGVPIPDQSLQIKHIDSSGPTTLRQYDPRQWFWVPIAPGTDRIGIENFNAFPVNFSITLGVDG